MGRAHFLDEGLRCLIVCDAFRNDFGMQGWYDMAEEDRNLSLNRRVFLPDVLLHLR